MSFHYSAGMGVRLTTYYRKRSATDNADLQKLMKGDLYISPIPHSLPTVGHSHLCSHTHLVTACHGCKVMHAAPLLDHAASVLEKRLIRVEWGHYSEFIVCLRFVCSINACLISAIAQTC